MSESPNLRIVNTKKGFRVEILKSKWTLFGIKKYWTHFISYAGIPDKPFHYPSFDMAMEDLLKEIRWELINKQHE